VRSVVRFGPLVIGAVTIFLLIVVGWLSPWNTPDQYWWLGAIFLFTMIPSRAINRKLLAMETHPDEVFKRLVLAAGIFGAMTYLFALALVIHPFVPKSLYEPLVVVGLLGGLWLMTPATRLAKLTG